MTLYKNGKIYANISADGGSNIDVSDIPLEIIAKIQKRLVGAAGNDGYAPLMDVVKAEKDTDYLIWDTGYPNENATRIEL